MPLWTTFHTSLGINITAQPGKSQNLHFAREFTEDLRKTAQGPMACVWISWESHTGLPNASVWHLMLFLVPPPGAYRKMHLSQICRTTPTETRL